jgi:hypothetical protein
VQQLGHQLHITPKPTVFAVASFGLRFEQLMGGSGCNWARVFQLPANQTTISDVKRTRHTPRHTTIADRFDRHTPNGGGIYHQPARRNGLAVLLSR